MASSLHRRSVATSLGDRFGALVQLISLLGLWALLWSARPVTTTETADADVLRIRSGAASASMAAAAPLREDFGGSIGSIDDLGGVGSGEESTESDPTDDASPAAFQLALRRREGAAPPPRFDRFAARCCPRLSLTRAPPVGTNHG